MLPDIPSEESIGGLLARLVADTRAFVQAQIALYKAQASSWIAKARTIAIFGVIALIFVHMAIVTLFIGLLLTLAPRVGPGWATVIVVGGTLVVAIVFGWLAYRKIGTLGADKAAP